MERRATEMKAAGITVEKPTTSTITLLTRGEIVPLPGVRPPSERA